MNKIDNRTATIVLSNKFYDKETIVEAIEDFNDFLTGKILNQDFKIELKMHEEFENETVFEFQNYVLDLMKNKTLI